MMQPETSPLWVTPECEFPAIFHTSDREKAKAGATGPTLEYISRLEEIARAAFALWKAAPLDSETEYLTEAATNVYEHLYTVDFMDEL